MCRTWGIEDVFYSALKRLILHISVKLDREECIPKKTLHRTDTVCVSAATTCAILLHINAVVEYRRIQKTFSLLCSLCWLCCAAAFCQTPGLLLCPSPSLQGPAIQGSYTVNHKECFSSEILASKQRCGGHSDFNKYPPHGVCHQISRYEDAISFKQEWLWNNHLSLRLIHLASGAPKLLKSFSYAYEGGFQFVPYFFWLFSPPHTPPIKKKEKEL